MIFVVIKGRDNFDAAIDLAIGQNHGIRPLILANFLDGLTHVRRKEAFYFHPNTPLAFRTTGPACLFSRAMFMPPCSRSAVHPGWVCLFQYLQPL